MIKCSYDHKGLTSGKASSLGSQLLHCDRRVEHERRGYHKRINCEKGGVNGEGVMKKKQSKFYHLQKGQDAQER